MSEEMRISLTREQFSLLYRIYLEAREPGRKRQLRDAVAAYEAWEARDTPKASENR